MDNVGIKRERTTVLKLNRIGGYLLENMRSRGFSGWEATFSGTKPSNGSQGNREGAHGARGSLYRDVGGVFPESCTDGWGGLEDIAVLAPA
jgi:hypothetical protein